MGSMFPMRMDKGKFTRWAKARNLSVDQAISVIEKNPARYSKDERRMATLAKTLKGFTKKREQRTRRRSMLPSYR